ncbi:c-type cytochrome [Anaerolineae bacterium CFX9]|nr:c-type cytochrome [Anaerolineae bacterium CFX9]
MSRARIAVLIVLCAALTACSGLAGEPRIVATIPPPSPAPTEAGFPLRPPDLRVGAQIYAARCIECHGITGAGDGALVQSGQIVNAGNFTDPQTASSQRPTDWHETITNGRIENLMPPWRDALSEEQRWAVGFYTYTMHYTAGQLARGRELYAQHCAECHGERGAGDGPRAAELAGSPGDLTDAAEMSVLSDQVIYNIISEGVGLPDEAMPGFHDVLNEDERRDLAKFTRTLSLANVEVIAQGQPQPAATAEAEAAVESFSGGIVSGQILNGTAMGRVPAEMGVEMFVLDADFRLVDQFATVADAAGRFSIAEVPIVPDGRYIARVAYRDRIYTTRITPASAFVDGALDLPITIYELTEDPAVLTIEGLVTQVTAVGDSLQVLQVFNFRNDSDRAYSTSATTEEGLPISVVISLPPGALIMGFGEQGRYVASEDQTAVVDTLPVLPGQGHLVEVIYLVPYNGDAIVEQAINYSLAGQVRLLARPLNIGVRSDQLPSLGVETVGSTEYAAYGASLTLSPGQAVRYQITGAGVPVSETGQPLTVTDTSLPLAIIIGIALEVLLVIGLVVWFRRRRAASQPARSAETVLMDALIRQIAELDADYEAGRLAQDDYERQRAALKGRLAALMTPEQKS